MLQCLDDWRAQCSEQQLAGFEHLLSVRCDGAITQPTITKRYQGSYHRALINNKVLKAACETHHFAHRPTAWSASLDAGIELTRNMAEHDGVMPIDMLDEQEAKPAAILLQRGVIFEQDGKYCLPAEFVAELRSKRESSHWLDLVCNTTLAMLKQIVPADTQEHIPGSKATRNELAAWLIVNGEKTRSSHITNQLNESDWSLLLSIQQHNLDDFETLQQRYPDLPCVQVTQHYYYNNKQEFSLRKSLEQWMPEQLCKLCRLGLIGIITRNGDNKYAAISLCKEAEAVLKPHWAPVRKRIAAQLQKHWQAEPCDAEYPAAWSMDQLIWRLWITLHFLPLGVTQQGKMRKNDLKKMIAVLKEDHAERIEYLIICMLKGELLKQDGDRLIPLPINWVKWRKLSHATIIDTIRSWENWNKQDEKQAVTLLSKLPVDCWLKLDEVVEWLRAQSSGKVTTADWLQLFSGYRHITLHHLNVRQRSIYLLPVFKAVLKQQPVSFSAPGWHGADKKAKTHGFISAAGEIQLPPDCHHSILDQLTDFCSISAVEQMITLQLDQKALQRMGTNKAALKKTRTVLESLQSPLPQAVTYLFEKQASQKPVAAVAATSMVIVLNEVSAIHKLRKTGFEFSQPFKSRPEIVLLDASADAHAFLKTCADDGIMLKTLIKPAEWISGTASINAWMGSQLDRQDQWLEISYQKTRSTKPKQIIARIEDDYYGAIRIQLTRKTKQGYALLKSMVQLQPKHVLRLRELDDAEIKDLGLDIL